MGVPYCKLDLSEQVKDGDNVVVAKVFDSEIKKYPSVNQEICKDICRTAKSILENRVEKGLEEPPILPEKIEEVAKSDSQSL